MIKVDVMHSVAGVATQVLLSHESGDLLVYVGDGVMRDLNSQFREIFLQALASEFVTPAVQFGVSMKSVSQKSKVTPATLNRGAKLTPPSETPVQRGHL
jgi:hypothetical protein